MKREVHPADGSIIEADEVYVEIEESKMGRFDDKIWSKLWPLFVTGGVMWAVGFAVAWWYFQGSK